MLKQKEICLMSSTEILSLKGNVRMPNHITVLKTLSPKQAEQVKKEARRFQVHEKDCTAVTGRA